MKRRDLLKAALAAPLVTGEIAKSTNVLLLTAKTAKKTASGVVTEAAPVQAFWSEKAMREHFCQTRYRWVEVSRVQNFSKHGWRLASKDEVKQDFRDTGIPPAPGYRLMRIEVGSMTVRPWSPKGKDARGTNTGPPA